MNSEPMTPKQAYYLGYHVARANYTADNLPNAERLAEQCKVPYEKAFASGVQSYCNKWMNDPYRNNNWTLKSHKPYYPAFAFRNRLKVIRND